MVASFEHRVGFFYRWKYWAPAIVLSATPFIAWDVQFTKRGIWGFNPEYLTGIKIINLPIEEWLFFICIPYACLFTYAALGYLLKPWWEERTTKSFSLLLILVLGLVAIFNFNQAYTFTTFSLMTVFLIIHQFWLKSPYLGRFYQSYLFILIPFFLVNGVLTGSFIPEEVVWYDDRENLGLRMFTIPVEDTFYGMFLILLNVTIYEYLKKSNE